uniref:thiol S-methyltransferase TMT1A-like n=1 Tax=Myxine glutinosa TaxID=7769 RepID=UPI00358E4A99
MAWCCFLCALLGLPIALILLVFALDSVGLWRPLNDRIMPYMNAHISKSYNKKMESVKQELFKDISKSSVDGKLTILEIGVGGGANFCFYPPGTEVICAEPNPHFDKFLKKSASIYPNVSIRDWLVTGAEQLPTLKDGSCDVVVCTLVLCGVKNIDMVIKETHRVLRPGGVFYILEHVAAPSGSWLLYLQRLITPFWSAAFCGCCLTRDPWQNIQDVGFTEVDIRHFSAPLNWLLIRPHIVGHARK